METVRAILAAVEEAKKVTEQELHTAVQEQLVLQEQQLEYQAGQSPLHQQVGTIQAGRYYSWMQGSPQLSCLHVLHYNVYFGVKLQLILFSTLFYYWLPVPQRLKYLL